MKPSNKRLGAIALAIPLVMAFEGVWLTAKPDRLAHGIPTVCYGETEDVKLGETYTPQECADMLALKLPTYADKINACIKVPISDKMRAAFISFAYNVGSAGFCRSTSLKRLNRGDKRGACDALMNWNVAGGRVVRGLTNRRAAERRLCLEGLQ